MKLQYKNTTIFLVGIFAFALMMSGPIYGQKGRELKVMAYNIHHANPPSKPDLIDIEAIAKVINSSQPDLVALQEVDVNTERSGVHLNQAKELARLTGMNYYFEPSMPYQGGGYGNAILTKFPIEKQFFHQLPTKENSEPRAVLIVQVTLPGNQKVKFASTHLDFKSDAITTLQAEDIVSYFNKEKIPVIIAGDFNAISKADAIQLMDKDFERTCHGDCPPTIPVIKPNKAIDFVFFKPQKAFAVKHHEVIAERYASDHLPVFAILAY
ncbi:endonuclease/exonuclease/phosphatase family protein [Cyclobacterium sp. 1_MG-2023]|uniref:endonuclease/exonuclease/phosphatase family protein n=1 Tax=Cyclobacterium sp. 1_MG-2023 TaxID=3062681 RepID=UPI0026E29FD2|nr:endonuclease/exonuclease/phosphatase family protein [Cyclobacterium sp. 1_MG-2023]MDO6438512.1 endonuclease/exonuclease/phosphatase family protein [Cyclobacterium sp. 1_MG-2023]